MYNTSKPSLTKYNCSEEVVSCEEYFQQAQENSNVNDTVFDEELAKQSVDISCLPADNCIVKSNNLLSASNTDVTDVNSDAEVVAVAKPDWHIESHTAVELENFWAEETANIAADGTVRQVECEVDKLTAVDEMLNCISSAVGTPCVTHEAAIHAPADDDNSSIVESVAKDEISESLVHRDSILQDDVSSELTGEEKIGFEEDAITAAEQWPQTRSLVVEQRVKRLQREVRQLLFDENRSSMKRELRKSGRMLRKIRRSPLQRLRTMVSLRPSSQRLNRLSSRVDSKGN